MNTSERILKSVQRWLPGPFVIALILTLITFVAAMVLTGDGIAKTAYALGVLGFWEKGFWELLEFTLQMVLILVLGHTLALTPAASAVIGRIVRHCTSNARSAYIVTLFTIVAGLLNWGLGLMFGAILARKVAEHARKHRIPLNFPLIGACAYVGMMVWHGGFSGSAPLAVNSPGHIFEAQMGILSTGETLYSSMNITTTLLLLVLLPLMMFGLGKKIKPRPFELPHSQPNRKLPALEGAEKLDASRILGMGLGVGFIIYASYKAFILPETFSWQFLNLNYINFLLFGLGLLLHGTIQRFTLAFEEALPGATGIIIQFPLYAGIIGIMKYSGLIAVCSAWFVQFSTPATFPFFTFVSAALINIFVPSGGGQWALQGPIIIEACKALDVPFYKGVMALAYGDEVTNMLQPFWALPIMGITGLKASEILPYTFLLFLAGLVIFGVMLLVF
ncbi:short-chain fatty acid transporter [soil metagenome]